MSRFLFLWTFLGGLFLSVYCFSQQQLAYKDTLLVSGKDAGHLSQYAFYHNDSTGIKKAADIDKLLNELKMQRWELGKTLNMGLNPYPLWLYMRVKNTAEFSEKYWWSIYSHADSIYVFEKSAAEWQIKDTMTYAEPLANRNVKARFMASQFVFEPGEYKEILMQVKNHRHAQNAITDFTIPTSNLQWEKHFYWNIGFFVGCFLIFSVISLAVGLVLKEKVFIYYTFYLLLLTLMVYNEELIITAIKNEFLFYFMTRVHTLPLAIMAITAHFYILKYIVQTHANDRLLRILDKINSSGFIFGLLFLVYYMIMMENIMFSKTAYRVLWSFGIYVAALMVVVTLLMVLFGMWKKQLLVFGIGITVLLFIFNPVGYFLNYSGLLPYYKITYPNYFYWIVCLEFLILGCFLTWRYDNVVRKNLILLQEKAEREDTLLQRELEVQVQERKQIARDLHDNLGATLSIIKLVITSSYKKDTALVNMITKANTDLRHFFTKLHFGNYKDQNFQLWLEEKMATLSSMDNIQFQLITMGNLRQINIELQSDLKAIVNELLSNVIKHADATEVTLQVLLEKNQLQLICEDNGKGFDTSTKVDRGMGLDNLNRRVKHRNGDMHISSNQLGTTSIITINI